LGIGQGEVDEPFLPSLGDHFRGHRPAGKDNEQRTKHKAQRMMPQEIKEHPIFYFRGLLPDKPFIECVDVPNILTGRKARLSAQTHSATMKS
jgi:hypothetical protein